MNDRYLFRGKRTDNGEWIYGLLGRYNADYERANIIDEFECLVPVKTETVGQYTGLTDTNGKKIYEGDVVRVYGGEYCQGYWEYDHQRTVKDIRYDSYELGECEYIEVIDNIHDDGELLKGENKNER